MGSSQVILLQIFLLFTLCTTGVTAQTARVLIYSATAGFRHDSIPTAINVLMARGGSIDTEFVATEDSTQFNDNNLASFDALVFLSTTGDVLDNSGKAAFQKYLNLGGNFVGIHSASDTLRNDTAYTKELGSLFDYHPELQNFTVDVPDSSHPSTSMLPAQWTVADEAYNFQSDPRSLGAIVILAANESSYIGERFNQGSPHPIAWFQEKGAGVEQGGTEGRSFYTSLGHLNETWQDDLFISHILGGISWVLQSNTTKVSNSSALVGNKQVDKNGSASSTSQSSQSTGTGTQSQPPGNESNTSS
ncbi:class I glutamine amidotransferase-like protein [Agrocybe pediades]|nr:class I glutamine amidotransferase-like protein [Agrocybe pediades]